jgi:DNA-binding transcriptional ArsR family regulator
MQQNSQSKLLKFALDDKQIAVAILGQAILDEGGIGASGITIFYTNKGEAEQLWTIANSLGYANPFRKKKHRNHYHYGFSIKASKIKEFYDKIGPLPNTTKDRIFRHLANRRPNINIRARGETRKMILQSLKEKPKTVLQLMLELDIGGSTVRKHLKKLKREGLVEVYGRYKNAFQKSRRTAKLWTATKDS